MAANRSRQAIISREQFAVQLLGKRDICSIAGGEVRPELEHPTKERLMSVTKERQIQIVLEGIRGTHRGEPPREQAPSKACRDLDVAERWRVEVDLGCLQDAFNRG